MQDNYALPFAVMAQQGEFTPEDIVLLGFNLEEVKILLKSYLENRIITQTKLGETYRVLNR